MQQKWTLLILTCLCLPITHQVVQSTLHFDSNQIKSSNITNIWGCSFRENTFFSMPCFDRKLPFLATGPDLVDFDLKSDIWGFFFPLRMTIQSLSRMYLFSYQAAGVGLSGLKPAAELVSDLQYISAAAQLKQLFCLQSTTPFSCPDLTFWFVILEHSWTNAIVTFSSSLAIYLPLKSNNAARACFVSKVQGPLFLVQLVPFPNLVNWEVFILSPTDIK